VWFLTRLNLNNEVLSDELAKTPTTLPLGWAAQITDFSALRPFYTSLVCSALTLLFGRQEEQLTSKN